MKTAPSKRLIILSTIRIHPALLTITLAALFLTCFRTGVRVTVGGQTLPGVYSIFEFYDCLGMAEAVAYEITMQPTDLRASCDLRLGLGIRRLPADIDALGHLLLENAEGVSRLWAVKLGGEILGWVSDPSVMGELAGSVLAEGIDVHTVSASFSEDFTITPGYAPDYAKADPMLISARLNELAEVIAIKKYQKTP